MIVKRDCAPICDFDETCLTTVETITAEGIQAIAC